jgi:hypothetical protein
VGARGTGLLRRHVFLLYRIEYGKSKYKTSGYITRLRVARVDREVTDCIEDERQDEVFTGKTAG